MSDPDLIKYVIVTNAKNYLRSPFVRSALPSVGNGLFSSNGRDHAIQRKMMNPAFHYSNLTGMVDDFQEVACNLVTVSCYKYYFWYFLHLLLVISGKYTINNADVGFNTVKIHSFYFSFRFTNSLSIFVYW